MFARLPRFMLACLSAGNGKGYIYVGVVYIIYYMCMCIYSCKEFRGMILRVRETFKKIIERDESRGWLLIAS